MARTYKRRTDEIEEFNDDALRMQENDTVEQVSFSLEDDDVQTLELGDRSRKSFARLNDRDLFSYRD